MRRFDGLAGALAVRLRPQPACFLMGIALCLTPLSLGADGQTNPYDDQEEAAPAPSKMPPGEAAARRACSMCHVFPTPDMLDKKHWKEQVLPRMQVRLGVALPDYSSSPEGELIKQRKAYTETPMIPVEQWPLIEQWMMDTAPDKPLPLDPRPEITVGLKLFKTERPRFRTKEPTTTLVKISPKRHQIYVGDDREKSLFILNADGELADTIKVGNVPVDVVESGRGIYVTCVGSFMPTEVYCAELLFFERKGDGFGEKKVILKELPRATQAEFADFNGDGKLDFALCMFGNLTGRFSWFENLGDDQYREHVLTTKAGAIRCLAHDFNGDGKVDLAVLMAQELEMLIIMFNDGKGNFTGDTVIHKPAVWGHVYFELVDYNKDQLADLLVVNGDNGEYDSPLKKYHGLRIYANKGNNQYEEAWFYPMNGAYKATARDFDGDGDLDIAAISFFPDYKDAPKESFVYLENQGGFQFKTATFRECIAGRWIVMDVEDLDGDGDLDIVLGSCIYGPSPVPTFLLNLWKQQGPSVLILRNQLSESKLSKRTAPSKQPALEASQPP
jgi:hypothetical protein